mmetsp:Transcript_16243/g.48295  ORF Transcript_16243/g.48295 Transcript_16243/m.48295 type:complete len:289 (-) Transcript_16243:26-892(-)
MLNTTRMFRKWSGEHARGSSRNIEYGWPQASGDGFAEIASGGAAPRGQNHVRMWPASGSHSAAKVPPPFMLNSAPIDPAGPCCEQPWLLNCPGARMSQLFAYLPSGPRSQVSAKSSPARTAACWQAPDVCNDVIVLPEVCTPSMISYSPQAGHGCLGSSPYSQNAGHVPHPVGMCSTSATNNPLLYVALDWMRTDLRPVTLLVRAYMSTPRYTRFFVALAMPAARAAAASKYCTLPPDGSATDQKSHLLKKSSLTYASCSLYVSPARIGAQRSAARRNSLNIWRRCRR